MHENREIAECHLRDRWITCSRAQLNHQWHSKSSLFTFIDVYGQAKLIKNNSFLTEEWKIKKTLNTVSWHGDLVLRCSQVWNINKGFPLRILNGICLGLATGKYVVVRLFSHNKIPARNAALWLFFDICKLKHFFFLAKQKRVTGV